MLQRLSIVIVGGILLSALPSLGVSTVPSSIAEADFPKQIQPLFKQYCYSCHSGSKPRASLGLDKFTDEAAFRREPKVLEALKSNLSEGLMPPEDKKQPTPAERERLVKWVDEQLTKASLQGEVDPGRVTMRRLNRVEYNNTIRDLVGVDFQPAEDFPADDVGYGFDHIGDVLAVSPLLLEKYLVASEQIMKRTIAVPPPVTVKEYTAEEIKSTVANSLRGGRFRWLYKNGSAYLQLPFRYEGEYVFRIRAFQRKAGEEAAKMSVRFDEKEIRAFDVETTEDRPKYFEVRHRVQPGEHRFSVYFTNDYYKPDDPDTKNRDRDLIIESIHIRGPINIKQAPPDSHGKLIFVTPSKELPKREAARKIVERFATRAYRRPVKPAEVDRLLQLFDKADRNGEPFERCIQLVCQAVLMSPHFLFRVELGKEPSSTAKVQALSDHELASRLSYFLWSSMPDEELFRLAQAGELQKPKVLSAQTKRMLRSPKAKAFVENFTGQWLQLRSLATIQPDPKLFPQFDRQLRDAMRTEAEQFFASILQEDRSIFDLLQADYTFVNERLAKHYGIAGVTGAEFRRVKLTDDNRGGILTMASILTVTSNPTRTSPVKRGKWILENILNAPPPPPPPDAGDLSEDEKEITSASLRQRMEKHRTKAECAVCHAKLDPLGFGLENFDAIGAWRTHDGKFKVDSTGELPGGKTFRTPKELKAIILSREEEFRRCLIERLLTYALGRGMETADRATIIHISETVQKQHSRLSSIMEQIVLSDAFRKRRG
jgi:hypothetical protein